MPQNTPVLACGHADIETSTLGIPDAQVLPADVDYRVMLTFLDFYHSLLQFVLFKLYHGLGVRYPPRVDPKLEEAAAGLTAIMQVHAPVLATLWGGYRAAVHRPCPCGNRHMA